MQLWTGLGNPEPQMAANRHNAGFLAVEALAKAYRFSSWNKSFKSLMAQGEIAGEKVFLQQPLTYMNLSGEAVRAAAAFYKIPPEQIVVFHDELDLALGRLRVKKGGGAAGHNGLRSILSCLGGADFWRVRIGIDRPLYKEAVAGYVLSDFSQEEKKILDPELAAIAEAAPLLVTGKADDFVSRVALLLQKQGITGKAELPKGKK